MNTALSWIKAYVPELEATDEEYTEAMTLTGTKVEGYERLDGNLANIVVGEILSIEKHPDADKLIVCQCNIGNDTIQIVTGASNVSVGNKVPIVLDGGRVATAHSGEISKEGVKIKKGKLRGVESNGMMCSIAELGSTKDFYPDACENGIYILPNETPVGSDVIELLGKRDTVFEYEITSNRVDCYSVIGIAREAAATFKKKFILPEIKPTGNDENISDYLSLKVEDSNLCKRYCARMVKDVKLAPSPKWLQLRLVASGIRPINNIVDITNYVMEEYGQPMHAFDYALIEGKEIIVKRAEDGEKFQTLDGQERELSSDMLMICDKNKSIALAGIMGGENSKIGDNVNTLIFESATFDGTNVRLSSKKLGLRTDASSKFEKGLDPNNASVAIDRACELIEELNAGTVVGGLLDFYPERIEDKRVKFEPEKINKLLGTDISKEDMLEYFSRVDLKPDATGEYIVVPTFRQDIECMADLAEEVARFYGYDKIPTTLPTGEATMGGISYKLKIEEIARKTAMFLGFFEAMSYSFESPKVYNKLLIESDSKLREAIEIMNPLGEDFSIMRTISLNGILESLSNNYNRRNKNVKLFELANIYLPKALPIKELPDERMQFTLGFYGDGDFFTMKGVVEEFMYNIGIREKINYNPDTKKEFLHPGRKADIVYNGEVLGYMGEIHPQVADNYRIGEKVYIAVLDMPAIMPFTSFDIKYKGIAKYPGMTRDISMVVPKDVLVGQIEEVIEKSSKSILESYELFDIYEGSQIMEGYKSIAYSISFRHKDRTLEEKEVSAVMEKILKDLDKLNIKLRA